MHDFPTFFAVFLFCNFKSQYKFRQKLKFNWHPTGHPETGAKMLGDIVISVPTAVKQARKYGHTFRREIGYLTVHAMLHLLGYDHESKLDTMKMREKEENIMNMLGLPRTILDGPEDL